MILWLNVLACLVFAVLRLGGMTHDFFKDLAHVYIGGLFVYGWQDPKFPDYGNPRHLFFRMAVVLTAVEVIAFVMFKYGWLTKVIG